MIASQSTDPGEVATTLSGGVPGARRIWYQKHMTLHLLDEFPRDWMARVRNAFLIREPEAVLASYAQKRSEVTLADLGFVQQRELFTQVADRLGRAPPVVDAVDVLAGPAQTLARLCAALEIPFTTAMLKWPAGRRSTDGVWAPAWYQAVERSTGFEAPAVQADPNLPALASPVCGPTHPMLPATLRRLADEARPHYEALRRHRLVP